MDRGEAPLPAKIHSKLTFFLYSFSFLRRTVKPDLNFVFAELHIISKKLHPKFHRLP